MIEINHLFGGYSSFEVVKNVSLTFPNGQISVVIGPNGSGKSTLFKICCGNLSPKKGHVIIDGKDIKGLSRNECAKKIAIFSQYRSIPDITVERLVLHGRFPWLGYPRIYGADDINTAKKAMERTGILEKSKSLISHLSGGERQKAYLAMLLTQNTDNILFDEPSTYLDISCTLELLKILSELKNEGKCIAAIFHDLGTALKIADKIAVIKDGEILIDAAPKEVINSGAIEKAFNVGIKLSRQYEFYIKQ
ncbi:MAG: ABC transporter ATP-binding protein [Oscillospiraceae bacterium]|nr:ABC transporter ATP-binding protein [Oscillospiraceae bacterium]